MKKIVLSVVAVALLSLSLLAGCGGNENASVDMGSAAVGIENPKTLEGTVWNVIRFESKNGQETPGDSSRKITVKFKNGEATISGLWEDGDKSIPYSYEDGYLDLEDRETEVRGDTIIVVENGVTMIMVREK